MRIVVLSILGMILAATPLSAGGAPALISLDTLSEYYAAVRFDHATHVDLAESCARCHHHTTGEAAEPRCSSCHQGHVAGSVACRDCHPAQPFSAAYLRDKEQDRQRYHIDKLGLKAAYHRNCLGCHQESGGPLGCQDCHPRTPAGDQLFHDEAQAATGSGTGTAH